MVDGRDEDLARVRAPAEAAARGRGGALLVHGRPGPGRAALLDAAAAVPGVRALRTAAPDPAAPPFAALAPVLTALAGARDRLPASQARALAVGTDAGRLAAGAALRALLGAAAADGPLLVVADGLDRLDAASRDALLFVARRPPAGVGLLLGAGRPGAAPGIAALAAGAPDVAAAAPAARRALVAAAALEDATVGRLLAALAAQGLDAAALDEAERAGWLRIDGERVAFAHPRVRAAVDRAAGADERAAAHRALAATAPD
ncbi:MAG: ATP-binding protein, partial [Solirubrobacteraceae bacterium]|nr:ATP-binding protein [Solirubrobacteraceae bacterium]